MLKKKKDKKLKKKTNIFQLQNVFDYKEEKQISENINFLLSRRQYYLLLKINHILKMAC